MYAYQWLVIGLARTRYGTVRPNAIHGAYPLLTRTATSSVLWVLNTEGGTGEERNRCLHRNVESRAKLPSEPSNRPRTCDINGLDADSFNSCRPINRPTRPLSAAPRSRSLGRLSFREHFSDSKTESVDFDFGCAHLGAVLVGELAYGSDPITASGQLFKPAEPTDPLHG